MNYILMNCLAKPNCFCKNWDGKEKEKAESKVRETCDFQKIKEMNKATECDFFVMGKERPELEWLWKNLVPSAEIPEGFTEIVEEPKQEAKIITAKPPTSRKDVNPLADDLAKREKETSSRTCADCEETATHKINGYRPIYLCMFHAADAKRNGEQISEIEETK